MRMMERKKFFKALSLGTIGILLSGTFPLRLFTKKGNSDKIIKVRINPLAVKRKTIGRKNV